MADGYAGLGVIASRRSGDDASDVDDVDLARAGVRRVDADLAATRQPAAMTRPGRAPVAVPSSCVGVPATIVAR